LEIRIVERASSAFEPSQDASAGMLEELELNRPAGLLLNDDRSGANSAPSDKLANFDFNDIAPAKFTINREIEHCTVAQTLLSI
jgi:hypothetical protein